MSQKSLENMAGIIVDNIKKKPNDCKLRLQCLVEIYTELGKYHYISSIRNDMERILKDPNFWFSFVWIGHYTGRKESVNSKVLKKYESFLE